MSTTAACNIDGREVGRRRRAGNALLAAGYALGVAALAAPPLLGLALPLALAGGVVATQARRRTCVAYALAGLEGDDEGIRRVGLQRAALLAALRVVLEGSLAALPLALLAALLLR